MTLYKLREKVVFKNVDELIEAIYDEYQSKAKLASKEKKKVNIKIKADVLWAFGIEDNTMILADERTMDILMKYDFLQNATHLINNSIWFQCVILLNKLKPRMF